MKTVYNGGPEVKVVHIPLEEAAAEPASTDLGRNGYSVGSEAVLKGFILNAQLNDALQSMRAQGGNAFLLEWEGGTRVPRGAEVGHVTVRNTQRGMVADSAGKTVGTYERIKDVDTSQDPPQNEMLVFIKPEIILARHKGTTLVLRQHDSEVDDIVCVGAVHEDPEHVDQHGNRVVEQYADLETAAKTRREAVANGSLVMGIWEDNAFLGNIVALPADDRRVEVAGWLRKSAVGHGHATLALEAMTEFLQARYARVFTEVNVDNHPSIAVVERAGYRQVGKPVDRDWGTAAVFEAV